MAGDKSAKAFISTRTILIGAVLLNLVAIGLSEVQRRNLTYRIEKEIVGQGQRIAEMQAAMGALSVLTKDGRFATPRDIQTAIGQRLADGRSIVIRFDDSPLEARDSAGVIPCGPEVKSGYLGGIVAGEEYAISYDRSSHLWTGSGPAQSAVRDAATGKCGRVSSAYGPEQLKKIVTPTEALILWGASFKLDGLDVLSGDKKVGRVIWAG